MDKIFIKPAKKELIVLKPDGTRLKPDGELVAAVTYWHRRLKDNEVEIVKNPKTPSNKDK